MNTGIRKTGDIAPLGVRMPSELKDVLTHAARQNGRSMNAEIVMRLQQSCEEEPEQLMASERLADYSSAHGLTDLEKDLLEVFSALPDAKKYGFIALFK